MNPEANTACIHATPLATPAALLQIACVGAAPLFVRSGFEGSGEAGGHASWEAMARLAGEPIAAPSRAARRALASELLVAGLPLAALPVESLHKPWCTPDGVMRASRGMYGGESAQHARALCDACGLSVPREFAAMPDHLALLLELLAFFLEAGGEPSARTLVHDHFDWLGSYDATLAARAEQIAGAPAFDEEKRRDLAEGIAFMRAVVRSVDGAVHGWADGSAQG